ncbi:ATP-binding protein [Alloalcanivorax xenomutans]|uniref:hybrid sensor histidine kinase/response regulator n=1 Tax=Alloalcanivorax xenomutans TaxID=1094342 RepID=UPI003D9BB11A
MASKRTAFPAIALMAALITVPFVLLALLILQHRLAVHDNYQRMLGDIRAFEAGLAVAPVLEEVRDLAVGMVHLESAELNIRYRGARERTDQRITAFLDTLVALPSPGLLDQGGVLRREWRDSAVRTGMSVEDVAGPFDNVEQINERLYATLAAVLYMSDLSTGTRPQPSEALSLPLNGLRELTLHVGLIRSIAMYTSLRGGYLSGSDALRLEAARLKLEEQILLLDGQVQALAARAEDAALRQQWRPLRDSLMAYLQWVDQQLVATPRVTVPWRDALEQGGERQRRVHEFAGLTVDLARRLVLQAHQNARYDTLWTMGGIAVLYLVVLLLSGVFLHFTTRAIRGRTELRAKSRFLARMSHEIRTPLNGVLGLAELLRETNPSPRQREYIGLIENAGRTLTTLINDVLDYAKLEAGKLELEPGPFDPAAELSDCARMFSLPASDNGNLILVDVDPAMPAQVIGDAPRLRQVFTNLLSNAVKFTRQGWIRVTARCLEHSDDQVLLEFAVSDSGMGMSREEQKRLFQHFSQASASVTRQFGGTGLGLSISQELVRLMGGEIHVRSAMGKGSRFRFRIRLPVSAPPVPMAEIPMRPALMWDRSGNLAALLKGDPRFQSVRILDSLASLSALPVDRDTPLLVNGVRDSAQLDSALQAIRRSGAGLQVVVLCGMRQSDDLSMRDDVTLVRRSVLSVSELQELLCDRDGAAAPLSSRASGEEGRGLRVLVAEDNPVNQMVTRGYLQRLGVPAPHLADDGAQALQAFTTAAGGFRLVLMDLDMPVMDGFTSARRMREMEREQGWPPTVILALSAHILPEYADRLRDAGMDGQLIKPLTLSALQSALQQYLGGVSAR